jgi:hypothetical protein
MTFTKETSKKVWSDEKGEPKERLTLPKEQARLVAESILELLELDYLGLTK